MGISPLDRVAARRCWIRKFAAIFSLASEFFPSFIYYLSAKEKKTQLSTPLPLSDIIIKFLDIWILTLRVLFFRFHSLALKAFRCYVFFFWFFIVYFRFLTFAKNKKKQIEVTDELWDYIISIIREFGNSLS